MTQEVIPLQTVVNFPVGPLIGQSPRMLRVFELIRTAAATSFPVLILGESGTGKELVGRAIHGLGLQCEHQFVPVDCPALAPTLIESELCGHVRGAFTGAISDRMGLLQSAGEGTLFLDEIAELPLELQSRFLRLVEEHEFKPVGSSRRLPFSARILAATNRNVASAVREGRFRRDLYFRLNVLSISLPPLRERKMDIPLLAEQLLTRFRSLRRTNGAGGPLVLSPEAIDRLLHYDWPGNVRELRNCLERAVASGSGPVIQASDILLDSELSSAKQNHDSGENIIPLEELERQAILRAMSVCDGDKMLAAHLLGIGKTTLYRKIRTYSKAE